MLFRSVEGNLAVYSSHLPLDAHPKFGNNILLARALGLKETKPFFFEKGRHLGVRGNLKISRDELARRLEKATGLAPKILPGGGEVCRKIGIVTGGAGAEMKVAASEGVDTFITGEGPHWTFAMAEELGLNVFYGGHYATETFGVKALAAHVARHVVEDHHGAAVVAPLAQRRVGDAHHGPGQLELQGRRDGEIGRAHV